MTAPFQRTLGDFMPTNPLPIHLDAAFLDIPTASRGPAARAERPRFQRRSFSRLIDRALTPSSARRARQIGRQPRRPGLVWLKPRFLKPIGDFLAGPSACFAKPKCWFAMVKTIWQKRKASLRSRLQICESQKRIWNLGRTGKISLSSAHSCRFLCFRLDFPSTSFCSRAVGGFHLIPRQCRDRRYSLPKIVAAA